MSRRKKMRIVVHEPKPPSQQTAAPLHEQSLADQVARVDKLLDAKGSLRSSDLAGFSVALYDNSGMRVSDFKTIKPDGSIDIMQISRGMSVAWFMLSSGPGGKPLVKGALPAEEYYPSGGTYHLGGVQVDVTGRGATRGAVDAALRSLKNELQQQSMRESFYKTTNGVAVNTQPITVNGIKPGNITSMSLAPLLQDVQINDRGLMYARQNTDAWTPIGRTDQGISWEIDPSPIADYDNLFNSDD